MYTVCRLQVRLRRAAPPPASSATEIAAWWEGRPFPDQEDLQEGAGPAQRWRPSSRAGREQTQSTAGAEALAHPWTWMSRAAVSLVWRY